MSDSDVEIEQLTKRENRWQAVRWLLVFIFAAWAIPSLAIWLWVVFVRRSFD
jgi:hypothetical protein